MDANKTDLYFPEHNLAIEIINKGNKDKNKSKQNEKENAIREHLCSSFIRINLDEKDFDIVVDISKICLT